MGPMAMAPGGMAPGGAMNPGMMQQMQQQMQNQQMRRQGGPAGGPGAPGGPGMPGMAGMMGGPGGPGGNAPGGTSKPADFSDPRGAVQAFLDALKARDLDRLAEATALRAQTEASARNIERFKRIYDGSLSESELDEIAKAMDGYQIMGENPAKSSGRVQVLLRKQGQNNSWTTRVVTVRHEKKGWGVLDISGVGEYKTPGFTKMGQPKRR
jgi:hypothetical protein